MSSLVLGATSWLKASIGLPLPTRFMCTIDQMLRAIPAIPSISSATTCPVPKLKSPDAFHMIIGIRIMNSTRPMMYPNASLAFFI